jgi:hypothetical protein
LPFVSGVTLTPSLVIRFVGMRPSMKLLAAETIPLTPAVPLPHVAEPRPRTTKLPLVRAVTRMIPSIPVSALISAPV